MKLKTRDLALISMFAALTAIGAFIRIPLPIVPFTLQYFFCALGGILLGSKKGALAQLLYIGIGLIGIPVFTKGGGPQYILQPTFGYLVGFIFCAFIIGKLTENIKVLTIKKVFLSCLAGLLVVYILGVTHMFFIYNFYLGEAMSVKTAVSIGALSCIPSDFFSSFLVGIVGNRIVPLLRNLRYA